MRDSFCMQVCEQYKHRVYKFSISVVDLIYKHLFSSLHYLRLAEKIEHYINI